MVDAALDLAERGWRVFPCIPAGTKAKAPLTDNGHLDATTEADTIREWWTRWPDAMIGAPVPDLLIVLDIDPRNGGSLDALAEAAGQLPETLTVWSGRGDGGRHLFFRRPTGEFTSTRLPKGIDLKVLGYTILPPSIHPATGEPYRWEVRAPALMPSPLRELLRKSFPAPRWPTHPTSASATGLINLVLALKDGERNRGLFWAACRAADDGLLAAVTEDLVAAAVSVGLAEAEARRTIASASKTGTRR